MMRSYEYHGFSIEVAVQSCLSWRGAVRKSRVQAMWRSSASSRPGRLLRCFPRRALAIQEGGRFRRKARHCWPAPAPGDVLSTNSSARSCRNVTDAPTAVPVAGWRYVV